MPMYDEPVIDSRRPLTDTEVAVIQNNARERDERLRDQRFGITDAEAVDQVTPQFIDSDGTKRPLGGEAAPHSRACGTLKHDHGAACHANCPTCGGKPAVKPQPKPKPSSTEEQLIEHDWLVTYNAAPGELPIEETVRAAYFQPTDTQWSSFKDTNKSPVAFVNNASARSVVMVPDSESGYQRILDLIKITPLDRSQVQYLDGQIWTKVLRG